MRAAISDTSFHSKIVSKYLKARTLHFMFPSMFFLLGGRKLSPGIINVHIQFNPQINCNNNYPSSIRLQKFEIHCKNTYLPPVLRKISHIKAKLSGLETEELTLREVPYHLKKTPAPSRIYEKIFGSREKNRDLANGTKVTYKNGQKFHPFLAVKVVTGDYFAWVRPANRWKLNYPKKVNYITLPAILNKGTIEHSNAAYNFFTRTKGTENQVRNSQQRPGNIYPHSMIVHHTDSINYLKTVNAQMLNGRNYFQIIQKHYNTFLDEHADFWERRTEKNWHILRFDNRTIVPSVHTEYTLSPAGITDLEFDTFLRHIRQSEINAPYDNIACPSIVFKKPHSENNVTSKNESNCEKTISTQISTDEQIKNISSQILHGEISTIANKVYKLLERKLSIEKEKRGLI